MVAVGLIGFTLAYTLSHHKSSAAPTATTSPIQTAYNYCESRYPALASSQGSMSPDGSGLTISTGSESGSVKFVACILANLNASDALVARMDHTNALMGEVSQSENGLTYSWSYHPDNGLLLTVQEG